MAKPKRRAGTRGQMSEALPTLAFLTLSGGWQDAYSYCVRGKVFANAQTGNIVLMSQHFFLGEWSGGLRYLIPLSAFLCGVFAAELLHVRFRGLRALHWRQLVVAWEAALLFAVGFLPSGLDFLANALVSFACAMQVQAFRKIKGSGYASTMCIGNLRSGMEALCVYLRAGDTAALGRAGRYLAFVLLFALGAGLGGLCSLWLARKTIWISCALLLASFGLMFLRDQTPGHPAEAGAGEPGPETQ